MVFKNKSHTFEASIIIIIINSMKNKPLIEVDKLCTQYRKLSVSLRQKYNNYRPHTTEAKR